MIQSTQLKKQIFIKYCLINPYQSSYRHVSLFPIPAPCIPQVHSLAWQSRSPDRVRAGRLSLDTDNNHKHITHSAQ